jgi:hypothetical protein
MMIFSKFGFENVLRNSLVSDIVVTRAAGIGGGRRGGGARRRQISRSGSSVLI